MVTRPSGNETKPSPAEYQRGLQRIQCRADLDRLSPTKGYKVLASGADVPDVGER